MKKLNYILLSSAYTITILAVKLKLINQDRMISDDLSVDFEPISLKFCKDHFLLKS